MLAVMERLVQSTQANVASVQEVRGELQTLREQIRDIPVAPPSVPQPLFSPEPPAPPARAGRGAVIAGVLAALCSLGALGVGAVVFMQQRHHQASLRAVDATTQSLSGAVAQLGEQLASKRPAPEAEPQKPAACPPPEPAPAALKAKVLLPNLIGLRLADARSTVAPLQLQLLPTDKKLKEASKVGWQSPSPGAELEPEEAVTVALKPPVAAKKKKKGRG